MATYTDSFTGADATALNTHDANWYGVSSSYGGIGTLALSSNRLSGAGHAVYAQPLADNAYVQAVVGSGSSSSTITTLWLRKPVDSQTVNSVRLSVRGNGYTALYDNSASAVWTNATTWPVGTVVRLECEGTTARIYKDGSLVHTYEGVATTPASTKYAGVSNFSGVYWDDFEAGDLVAASQTGSPISDISNTGWSPSTGEALYGVVDEVTPADADYIYTTASGSVCEVRLTSLSQPGTGTKTVSYRIYSSTSDNIQVDLVQNTTVIHTWGHAPAPATVTQFDQPITGTVTDWTNLRLRFTATAAA